MGLISDIAVDHDSKSKNKRIKSITESKVTEFSTLVSKTPHILTRGISQALTHFWDFSCRHHKRVKEVTYQIVKVELQACDSQGSHENLSVS